MISFNTHLMKACFYLIFFGESVQKIIFKESFYLLRPNMHYKIYGKKFETNVSNGTKETCW